MKGEARPGSRHTRDERWENGECHDCGKKVGPTQFRCGSCNKKRATERTRLEKERRANGQCPECGDPKMEGRPNCLNHVLLALKGTNESMIEVQPQKNGRSRRVVVDIVEAAFDWSKPGSPSYGRSRLRGSKKKSRAKR